MKDFKLNIEYLPVKALKPYEKNARKHNKEDVSVTMKSIEKYGFSDPIGIWSDNNIIVEGHGRLEACKKLGIKEVPVIRLDHLTDEERRQYALMHNKTAELSSWDFDILGEELQDLDFGDLELDWGVDLESKEPTEIIEDEVPEIDEENEPIAKVGDIWQLGEHRLMCGDSTDKASVQKLMGGGYADCVCTDPPYNMGYEGAGRTPKEKRKQNKIMNDNLPEDQFEKFLISAYNCLFENMKDGASFYIFYKELGNGVFMKSLEKAKLTFKQELIWVKNQIVLGGAKYQNMYEPCLFGCKGKSISNWYGGRKERSVIEQFDLMNEEELRETLKQILEDLDTDIVRERKTLVNDLHPTMKPIKLLAKLLRNSTQLGDCILDIFGGSGSTLIACEQLNRKCYMMEYEPKYVDVIIKRWENFTGKKAIKIN